MTGLQAKAAHSFACCAMHVVCNPKRAAGHSSVSALGACTQTQHSPAPTTLPDTNPKP